jgi:hypothetical protein
MAQLQLRQSLRRLCPYSLQRRRWVQHLHPHPAVAAWATAALATEWLCGRGWATQHCSALATSRTRRAATRSLDAHPCVIDSKAVDAQTQQGVKGAGRDRVAHHTISCADTSAVTTTGSGVGLVTNVTHDTCVV